MTKPSGVGPGKAFESVALVLLCGLRGLAETIKAAVTDAEPSEEDEPGTLESALLGILSLDQRLGVLLGVPDTPLESTSFSDRISDGDLLR